MVFAVAYISGKSNLYEWLVRLYLLSETPKREEKKNLQIESFFIAYLGQTARTHDSIELNDHKIQRLMKHIIAAEYFFICILCMTCKKRKVYVENTAKEI